MKTKQRSSPGGTYLNHNKNSYWQEFYFGSGNFVYETIRYEHSIRGHRKRWNTCRHYRSSFPSYLLDTGRHEVIYNVPASPLDCEQALDHLKANLGQYISDPVLEFQKNNKFRFFIFLFGIDDLFAKFTAKWVRRILTMSAGDSYKFVKWDLNPLVGDFEALVSTYYDLKSNILRELGTLKAQRFNCTIRIPETEPIEKFNGSFRYFSKTTFHGHLVPHNIPEDVSLPILLDEFGLNIRASDLFDAIPFSFLLSHVCPNVVAFLDSQHPSKWFDADYTFEGWVTSKLYCNMTTRHFLDWPEVTHFIFGFDRYKTTLEPTKKPSLIWKFPGISALTDAIALISPGASVRALR